MGMGGGRGELAWEWGGGRGELAWEWEEGGVS